MKKFLFILMTAVISSVVIGCANDSDSSNNSTPNNIISGTGSYSDIAAQFLPTDYPVLDLPNDIQYTQTTTVDSRYLELVTKLQKSYINNLLDTLSTYYNIQFDINNNQWHVENSEHSLDMSYDETLEELIFNFTFKPSQEIPEQPTDSLKVKDYIAIKSADTLTSDPAYSLIMLSTNGKIYVKGYNMDGEVGNGIICNDYDCMANYISSINEITGIDENVTKIFKTNINDSLFAVTETGKLYSWGNGNPTPRSLITISGQIKDIMKFNNNINYLYTNTNKLYELKYIDNIWSVKEIIIPNEKIMQVDFENIIYLLTESGKQYSYNHDTSDIEQISGINEKIKNVFHLSDYYDDLHIVITENNKIYGWGKDYYDEILDEYEYGIDVNIPKLLDWDISTNGMITQFFNSGRYIYAVTDKGLLYKFGYDAGIVPDINNITKIDTRVDIQYDYMITRFLITSDGSVYTLSDDEITKIDGLKNIKKFYTTHHYSYDTNIYAITENGDVYSTGSNYVGILGLGNPDKSYITNVAEKVNIPEPVEEIYTHINDTTYAIYAVTNNGNVYAWGNNQGDVYKATIGILGIGNTTDKYIPAPTKVDISNVTKITNIINDDMDEMSTAYALTKDNKLYHWGYSKNTPGGWSPDLIITPQLIDFSKQ